MNISRMIREQRNRLILSQEELAERIYVTRQTISNWENDKSYPDIHSLILLSQLFEITIDELVKGDLEIMEEKIMRKDSQLLKRHWVISILGLGIFFIGLTLMTHLGVALGYVIGVIALWMAIYSGTRIYELQKQHDVQTYREIVAFIKGEPLDKTAKKQEAEKRKKRKSRRKRIGWVSWWIFEILLVIYTIWSLVL